MLLILLASALLTPQPSASVRITQTHLTALCLDGRAVKQTDRKWTLPAGEHVLTVTMKNDPRPGTASADPGVADLRFTVAASGRYEIEVHAPGTSFSTRVWKSGDWTPVVRDRTADRIVSGDPNWTNSACK